MGFRFKDLFWISGEEEPVEAEPPVGAPPVASMPPAVMPPAVISPAVISPVSVAPSSRGVQSVERILHGLKDVDGVVGGLALRADGELVGQNLPGMFDQQTLERAGQRIAQMCAALNSEADGTNAPKGGALRFDGFQLYVNPLPSGTIGVLAEERVNVPALTMAMRVVARQLEAFLSSSNSAAPS